VNSTGHLIGVLKLPPASPCSQAQPRHPAARSGDRTSGQHAMPGRRRLAASAGIVPSVP